MNCQTVLKANGIVADGSFPSAAGETGYLLERPRLVLAMLDLMEKFERKSDGIDRKEVARHAP